MTFTYWLPDEQGQKQEYTTSNNSVIIIGANGSGKSHLGAWIEQQDLENVHRIGAQRNLNFNEDIALKSYSQAENFVFYGTDNKGYVERKDKANLSLSGELGKEYVSSTTSREIISKVLHDAAFDIAYGYIKPQKLSVGKNDSGEYGDYVELTRVFDFVDMDYLEKLFSKNGLIDFLKKNDKEKIETEASRATGEMNRAQLRSTEKTIKSELKKLIAESDKQYDDIHDIIVAFRQLMPYARMMISYDGYLIPMDDQYFRIDPQNLGFKYGGEITCVGMITNIIGADTNPNDPKNMFATLQFTVNEALRKILPTNKENLCVIHPIAVFYGK